MPSSMVSSAPSTAVAGSKVMSSTRVSESKSMSSLTSSTRSSSIWFTLSPMGPPRLSKENDPVISIPSRATPRALESMS